MQQSGRSKVQCCCLAATVKGIVNHIGPCCATIDADLPLVGIGTRCADTETGIATIQNIGIHRLGCNNRSKAGRAGGAIIEQGCENVAVDICVLTIAGGYEIPGKIGSATIVNKEILNDDVATNIHRVQAKPGQENTAR